ncbi:MAG: glycosyltransferase family 4 protein [Clostridia bacterium]|nr:glycosyltransferase family 4 protein [Clostridia bacterium]
MRVLFLSLLNFDTFDERNIYSDLLREFMKHGHEVYCIAPVEKRTGKNTHFADDGHLLKVKIGNIQKTNVVEKGISTLMIEKQFIKAIKKYFSNVKFDFVLYTTPPVTFANVIRYLKKRDGAITYLMLKDIFPQNAVDLGMMRKTGVKGLIYKYFRGKEKKLYSLSDHIGCMSAANIEYVMQNNSEITKDKVGLCPNSIEVHDLRLTDQERLEMRRKYGIPLNKRVFVYGGNLGKPQGVPFIVECLRACSVLENVYFVIVGSGTERYLLEKYVDKESTLHIKLLNQIPKNEYDKLVACCDIGLIFLDHRFSIPNFPSRLLSYMQAGLPVLACTDSNSDVGEVITNGDFGWWSESNNAETFSKIIMQVAEMDISAHRKRAWEYLCDFYDVQNTYLKCFAHLIE